MKIVFALLISAVFFTTFINAQAIKEDWENYVIAVNNHPVSIVVNLGLKEKAPFKERPFVIILRTKYMNSDPNGFPAPDIIGTMDSIEFKLEAQLTSKVGAVYAGRFTQRGLREFYFYALDTVQYLAACATVMDKYRDFPWLCKALSDKTWSNYFEVLYPSPNELEKIENRRIIEALKQKGDLLTQPREIEHMIYFKTSSARQSFLKSLDLNDVKIDEMPLEKTEFGDYGYKLRLSKPGKPDQVTMDNLCIYLRELALKNNGIYGGWQTYVVR